MSAIVGLGIIRAQGLRTYLMVYVVDLVTIVFSGRGRCWRGQGVSPPDDPPASGKAVKASPTGGPVLQRKLRYQRRLGVRAESGGGIVRRQERDLRTFEPLPRRGGVRQVGLGDSLLAGAAEDAAEAALALGKQLAPAHGHDGEGEDAPRCAVCECVQGAEGQSHLKDRGGGDT